MKFTTTLPLGLALIGAAFVVPPAGAVAGRTVHPGQSIQAAIDATPAGGTVTVKAGTYRASLTITRSIHLVARGRVTLLPPAKAPHNLCLQDPDGGGRIPGVCIAGKVANPNQESSPVTHPVSRVSVRGFRFRGFTAAAIEVYGARRLHLSHITAVANPGGGIFVSHSNGVHLDQVTALRNGTRGIDLHQQVRAFSVTHSRVAGNRGEGVLVGDSLSGRIARNVLRHNCAGILLLDEAIPGDHGVGGIRVTGNAVTANNRACPGDDEGAPSMSGNGILVVGAHDTVVSGNRVEGNHDGKATVAFGGLALMDASHFTGGAAPAHVRITRNTITGNSPADLTYDHSGSGVVISGNHCTGGASC